MDLIEKILGLITIIFFIIILGYILIEIGKVAYKEVGGIKNYIFKKYSKDEAIK
ncbi:MAG: hypothetical protein ACQEQE_03505 [Bacillota bacterium]